MMVRLGANDTRHLPARLANPFSSYRFLIVARIVQQ
jgi:hypothetical protein